MHNALVSVSNGGLELEIYSARYPYSIRLRRLRKTSWSGENYHRAGEFTISLGEFTIKAGKIRNIRKHDSLKVYGTKSMFLQVCKTLQTLGKGGRRGGRREGRRPPGCSCVAGELPTEVPDLQAGLFSTRRGLCDFQVKNFI